MFEKSSELLEDFNYFDQAFNQVAENATKLGQKQDLALLRNMPTLLVKKPAN